jgi:hypothetical protein
VLRQCEERLLLQPAVGGPLEDRVERRDRLFGPDLTEPEHRLLPHLGVGVGAGRRQQDILGALAITLGDQEHRLAPETGRAGVAAGQDALEDGTRLLAVHLNEGVHRGDLDVVIVPLAVLARLVRRIGRLGRLGSFVGRHWRDRWHRANRRHRRCSRGGFTLHGDGGSAIAPASELALDPPLERRRVTLGGGLGELRPLGLERGERAP